MANLKASKTDIRKTLKRTEANRAKRSRLKTLNKKSIQLGKGGVENAAEVTASFASSLDKAAKSHVIHKNKANRLKSKAAKRLAAASATQQ